VGAIGGQKVIPMGSHGRRLRDVVGLHVVARARKRGRRSGTRIRSRGNTGGGIPVAERRSTGNVRGGRGRGPGSGSGNGSGLGIEVQFLIPALAAATLVEEEI